MSLVALETDIFNIIAEGATATIIGGSTLVDADNDVLDVGHTSASTWTINGVNNTLVTATGNIAFEGIEVANGNENVDTFDVTAVFEQINSFGGADVLNLNANLPDGVFAGTGDDIINVGATIAGAINGEQGNDTFTITTINDISAFLVGGDIASSDDTIIAADRANIWQITSDTDATINSGIGVGITTQGMENFFGGSDQDEFTLSVGASIDGQLRGFGSALDSLIVLSNAADTINWTLDDTNETSSSITGRIPNGFDGVETVIGGAGSDVVQVVGAGFNGDIDTAGGDDQITLNANAISVSGNSGNDTIILADPDIDNVQIFGGTLALADDGSDLIDVTHTTATDWVIDGINNVVTTSGDTVNFAGIDSIQTNGDGSESVSDSFTISSTIATINSFNGADTFVLEDGADVTNAIFAGNGMDNVTINTSITGTINTENGSDTVTINTANDITVLIEAGDNGGNEDTLIGGDRINFWDITTDTAVLNTTVTANDFEHYTGGNLADTFVLANGNSIVGNVRGGAGATDSDTLEVQSSIGDTTNWNITAVDTGNVDGVGGQFFLGNLVGGAGSDNFDFANSSALLTGLIDGGESGDTDEREFTGGGSPQFGAFDTVDVQAFVDGIVVEVGPTITTDYSFNDDFPSEPDVPAGLDNIHINNIEQVTATSSGSASNPNEIFNVLIINHGADIEWSLPEVSSSVDNTGSVQSVSSASDDPLNFIVNTRINFENFGSLNSGSGSDIGNVVPMRNGVVADGNITGFFDRGDGGSTIILSNENADLQFLVDIHDGIEGVQGNGNTILRVTENDNLFLVDNTWLISGNNSGTFTADDGVVVDPFELSFTGVNHLMGGSGDDLFLFEAGGSLTPTLFNGMLFGGGAINGGGGVNTVDASLATGMDFGINEITPTNVDGTRPFPGTVIVNPVDLLANRTNIVDLAGIEAIVANSSDVVTFYSGENTNASDTLLYTWNIAEPVTGFIQNSITNGTETTVFAGFDAIVGGAADDLINIHQVGAFSNIDAGDGSDTLDISFIQQDLSVSLDPAIVEDFNIANIETVNSNILFDNTLIGSANDSTWDLSENTLTLNTNEAVFQNFNQLNGGIGNDALNVVVSESFDGEFVFLANNDLADIDSITFSGGSTALDTRYLPGAGGELEVVYENTTANTEYSVTYSQVENAADNATANTLLIDTEDSIVNTISLLANVLSIDLAGFVDIAFTNKSSLFINGDDIDTLTLDGVINANDLFEVSNAQVSLAANANANTQVIAAQVDFINNNIGIGSADNVITLNTPMLNLSGINGATFIDNLGSLTVNLDEPDGLVNITAQGNINDGLIDTLNEIVFVADDDVLLDNTANTMSDMISITADNIVLTNAASTQLGDINANNNFTLVSSGTVTDVGVISVNNDAFLTATGSDIQLDNPLNDFENLDILDADDALIVDVDDLTFQANISGDLSVESADILQTNGAVSADSVTVTAGNEFIVNNLPVTATRFVSVNSIGADIGANIQVTAPTGFETAISINSGNDDITLDGALIAANNGDINVIGNRIEQNGNVTGGDVILNALDEYVMQGDVDGSTIDIDAVNAITQGGNLTASGNVDLTSANNNIAMLAGNVTQGDTVSIDARNGDIDLQQIIANTLLINGVNITQNVNLDIVSQANIAGTTFSMDPGSVLTVSAGSADIQVANNANITSISADRISLDAADIIINGDVVADVGDLDIVSSGNVLHQGSLVAENGDVDLEIIGSSSLQTISGDTVGIDSADISIAGDVTADVGSVRITSGDSFTHVGTMSAANGDIDLSSVNSSNVQNISGERIAINAGDVVAIGDLIASAGNLTITSGTEINHTGSMSALVGSVLLDSVGSTSVGTLSADSISIRANGVATNGDVIADVGDVDIVSTGNFSQLANIDAANGEVDLDITGASSLNAINANTIDVMSGAIDVGGNLESDLGSVLLTSTGTLDVNADITSAENAIVSATEINMDSTTTLTAMNEASLSATSGNIDVSLIQTPTESGVVTISAASGAITDNNGLSVNVTGNSLSLVADSGIGAADNFETDITLLNASNGSGLVNLVNSSTGDLTVQTLFNNGNIFLNNTDTSIFLGVDGSPVPYDHPGSTSPTERLAADAREAGAIINAGFSDTNSRQVEIVALNGGLFGRNGADDVQPDIATNAFAATVTGGFGAGGRPLVLFVDEIVDLDIRPVGGLSPIFAFRNDLNLDPVLTVEGDLIDPADFNLGSADLILEVESAEEIDPAVFTDVSNYAYENISIRLPADQLFEDDDEDEEEDLLGVVIPIDDYL